MKRCIGIKECISDSATTRREWDSIKFGREKSPLVFLRLKERRKKWSKIMKKLWDGWKESWRDVFQLLPSSQSRIPDYLPRDSQCGEWGSNKKRNNENLNSEKSEKGWVYVCFLLLCTILLWSNSQSLCSTSKWTPR